MINKTPADLDKFPVPVIGQEIPRGWFSRLVAFVNSLVLHGDQKYFAVTHTLSGTSIKPTDALLQLASGGGTPPGGGSSCIPNYGAGESVTPGTPYTITSPGWIIGCVGANFPSVSGLYAASWQIALSISGLSTQTITLADFAKSDGAADTSSTFVSILLPACSFTVSSTTNLASGNLFCYLRAYPIL
jgi:hypothetical protein